MIKVGILTSGGDCQGLNGAMYGLVKGLTETNKDKVEIYGILDGYTGLINGDYKKMKPEEFENICSAGYVVGAFGMPVMMKVYGMAGSFQGVFVFCIICNLLIATFALVSGLLNKTTAK